MTTADANRIHDRLDRMEDGLRTTLREVRDEVRRDVREVRDELADVKQEVKQTNGRVRKLELWQARIGGAWGAVRWAPPAVAATVTGVIVAVTSRLIH